MRVCSLSNMPSFGVASRMLFISMFMNTASNCCAVAFNASGEFCAALVLSLARLLASIANPADISVLMAMN